MGKSQKQSRRELIEKMQREQARSDKRRTILIVTVAVVVGLAIIAYPAVKLIQDSRAKNASISDIGAKPAAASCSAPTDDVTEGNQDHKADGTQITYKQSPPSSGPHYPEWAPFDKHFYADDRPAIPHLVHNLEHGYTILWYDDSIAGDKKKLDLVERLAKAKVPDAAQGKFIAAPFHSNDGVAWPEGKHVAFSHWDGGDGKDPKTQRGHRQFCSEVSGEALAQFIQKYPASNAPEPLGG